LRCCGAGAERRRSVKAATDRPNLVYGPKRAGVLGEVLPLMAGGAANGAWLPGRDHLTARRRPAR